MGYGFEIEIRKRIIRLEKRKRFNDLTSLDISEVNTVGTTAPPPISKYFIKKGGPSGIRTHDLPHDGQRRYPLRHKSLDEATHGIFLILS